MYTQNVWYVSHCDTRESIFWLWITFWANQLTRLQMSISTNSGWCFHLYLLHLYVDSDLMYAYLWSLTFKGWLIVCVISVRTVHIQYLSLCIDVLQNVRLNQYVLKYTGFLKYISFCLVPCFVDCDYWNVYEFIKSKAGYYSAVYSG